MSITRYMPYVTIESCARAFVSDDPPKGANAIFWFFEMVAFSFVLAAVDALVQGKYNVMRWTFLAGAVSAVAGLKVPVLFARWTTKKALRVLDKRSSTI